MKRLLVGANVGEVRCAARFAHLAFVNFNSATAALAARAALIEKCSATNGLFRIVNGAIAAGPDAQQVALGLSTLAFVA